VLRSRLAFAASFLGVSLAAAASAQAPCPCPPAPGGPPPLWSGKGELSYLATTGNTDTSTFGAGIEVNYKPLPWTITLKGAFLRAEADNELKAESFAAALRGTRDLTPRIDVFVEGGYFRNRFAGIDSRYGGEAGAGYKVLDEKTLRLRFEAAFGYTREHDIEKPPSILDLGSFSYPTARAGLQFGWKFSKSAELTEELYWTENLDNTSDWILRSTTGLTAELTSIFALKASYTYLYDHVTPDPTIKQRDTITSVAIVAKF
jgi:putative salt-induced outer membrane protein